MMEYLVGRFSLAQNLTFSVRSTDEDDDDDGGDDDNGRGKINLKHI